jgi:hypothetical protein
VDLFHRILKMLVSLTRASLNGRTSLYKWSPKDWEEMQKDLKQILAALVQRKDVSGPYNEETNERFLRSIDRVKRIMKTNVLVSPMRAALRREKDGKQSTRDDLEASRHAMISEKDPHIRELLQKLFTKNDENQSNEAFRLKEDLELNQILGRTDTFPIALEKFPSFVRRIFKKLTRHYSIQHLSRYVSDDKEKITEKIEKDQSGRMSEQPPQKRLTTSTQEAEGQKHASDDKQPREKSQTRIMSSKQTPQKRVKTNTQASAKRRRSQEKKYVGRMPWSDEEKNAIRVGIQAKGVGNWAEIKEHQPDKFILRTSGMIKDCYRTMKRKGEIE